MDNRSLVKVIGVGAAGNKAAINLITKGVMDPSNIVLINSTLDDIPAEYRTRAIKFSSNTNTGGCGKERGIAKNLCLESFQNGTLNSITTLFEESLDPSKDTCIIVSSSEGGTGCGASTVIAKYFAEIVKTNVHMFVFTGFEDDARGLQNTVEYFKDLNDNYIVQAISNKKCLTGTNQRQAEAIANDEFVKRIVILLGLKRRPCEQNIDDTDLLKCTTTKGFMNIEYVPLDKIKNIETFNRTLIEAIDNSKSLDNYNPGQGRLGVFYNLKKSSMDFVDFSAKVIKDRYGEPYEFFKHIQEVSDEDSEEYVCFISSGMRLPLDEIKEVYEEYVKRSSSVNKSKDDFFASIGKFVPKDDDSVFDLNKSTPDSSKGVTSNTNVSSFLESFGIESPTGHFNKTIVHAKVEETPKKKKEEKTENGDIKV